MKPLELILKNIGPFHHETIDFTQLGDMFLVCGKTGAGKSTIFKAITYALYGDFPSDRFKVSGSELRSDFVSSNEEASITFTFLHHDNCYKIHRILPATHLNKKNVETTQSESALLFQKKESNFQELHTKKTETDKAIKQLMGLTVEEFSRIILLPQGKFAEFLKQNSNEKRTTLLKLFPLDDYETLIKTIKEKADVEKKHLDSIEQQIRDFGSFHPQEEEKKISEYEEILKQNSEKKRDLQNQLRSAEINIDSHEKILQEFIAFEEISQLLTNHLQQENHINTKKEQISLAVKAAPVYLKYKELEKIKKNFNSITEQRDDIEQELHKLDAEKNQLENQKEYFTELKAIYVKNNTLLHELKNALVLQNELDELLDIDNSNQNKITVLKDKQSHLNLAKNKLEQELNTLESCSPQEFHQLSKTISENNATIQQLQFKIKENQRYNKLNSRIQQKKQDINDAIIVSKALKTKVHDEKKLLDTLKEQNYAKQLAENLKADSPCPVCGSLHHPSPAHFSTNISFNLDYNYTTQEIQLEKLENELNELLLHISKEEGSLNELVQHLHSIEYTENEADLSSKLSELLAENKILDDKIFVLNNKLHRKKDLETELENNQKLQVPLQNEIDTLIQANAINTGKIQEKKHSLTLHLQTTCEYGFVATSIPQAYSEVNTWLTETNVSIIQYDENYSSNQRNLSAITARYQQQCELFTTCKNELLRLDTQINELLAVSDLSSIEQVINSYLTQDSIYQLQNTINEWTNQRIKLETQKTEIEKKLSGTKEQIASNLSLLEQQKETLQIQINEIDNNYKCALKECEQKKFALDKWLNLEAQRKEKQSSEALIRQLFTDISDNNPKRIAITTWILGVYLDQVVSCANNRLKRISDDRYTLHFLQEKNGRGARGLDLEILDSYTGKARPCSTLSGGETFMVSISLALALTDIVTSKRGGISLQSLFIDEGFGSLDPASLDKALSILEEVREGRCVGVISHVSEMQNRIPNKLEVLKTSTGSSVRLLVD